MVAIVASVLFPLGFVFINNVSVISSTPLNGNLSQSNPSLMSDWGAPVPWWMLLVLLGAVVGMLLVIGYFGKEE